MYRAATIQLEDGAMAGCISPPELAIHVGDACVIEFHRMPEYGRVVRLEEKEGEMPPRSAIAGLVLRRATLQDQARASENAVACRMAARIVRQRAEERKLPFRFLYARCSFDRSALTMTYASDDRLDLAEWSRALSEEVKMRVEFRVIGVRDAARLAGGMATCGRPLCCCSWLRDLGGSSVKMAKTQGLSLNPSVISGMCGRLKCCLRYEQDMYARMAQRLPREGMRVVCPEGPGQVADANVISQRVRVRLDDGRTTACSAEDVRPAL